MTPRLKYWLKLTASLGLLALVAYVLRDDVGELPAAFAKVSLGAFTVAFVLSVIGTIVLPAVASKLALRTERLDISLVELTRINFVIRFYSIVLPRGGAVGLRWVKYKKAGSAGDALALVLFEKIVMLLVMMLAAAVCLTFDRTMLPTGGDIVWIASLALLAATLAALVPFLDSRAADWLSAMAGKSGGGRHLPAFVLRPLERLWTAVRAFQNLTFGAVAVIVTLTLVGYVLFVWSPVVIARSMGLEVTAWALAWMRSLVFVLTLVPVTVAGIGVREAAFVGFLALYGIQRTDALAFALLLFAVQLAIGVVGAALELWEHLFRGAAATKSAGGS